MQIDFKKVCIFNIPYQYKLFSSLAFWYLCSGLTQMSCSRSCRAPGWACYGILQSKVNQDLSVKFARHLDGPSFDVDSYLVWFAFSHSVYHSTSSRHKFTDHAMIQFFKPRLRQFSLVFEDCLFIHVTIHVGDLTY